MDKNSSTFIPSVTGLSVKAGTSCQKALSSTQAFSGNTTNCEDDIRLFPDLKKWTWQTHTIQYVHGQVLMQIFK